MGAVMGPARILGLLMIALGAALLVATTTDIGGEIVVGMLGLGFLVAYVATRTYGLLIPGCILTGLGTGIVLAEQGASDGVVVLGLGLGFVTIAVVDVLVGLPSGDRRASGPRSGWWWPLIPGGILTLAGGTEVVGAQPVGRFVAPIVLIVLGVALLFRRRPRPAEPASNTTVIEDPPPPPPPADPPSTPPPPSSSDRVDARPGSSPDLP